MKYAERIQKLFGFIRRGERGFTLIEVLIAVAILGITAGIAIPNATGFVSSADDSIKVSEEYQVKLTATCYQAEGNAIAEAFTVGPADKGVLDSYLMGDLAHSWTIGTDGSVSESGSEPEPDPDPEPGPKPKPVKPTKPVKPIKPVKKLS